MYQWKIDDGDFSQYSAFDGLNIISLGVRNNLDTERATLDIHFSDEIVRSGSTVIVRISDMYTLSSQLTFNVK